MLYTLATGETTDCDCAEEYGPCEAHSVTLVSRNGASSRTADELALQLIADCIDLGARLSPDDAQEYARLEIALQTERDASPVGMGGWFADPTDGNYDSESAREIADRAESALSDAIPNVYVWQDDGYVIQRITSGPLLDEVTTDEADAFIAGHLEANLWANVSHWHDGAVGDCADCSIDARGHDVDEATASRLADDARDFLWSNLADVREYAERAARTGNGRAHGIWRGTMKCAGHDFALSRAGHGAGFFDRGLGELGERLQSAARVYGEPNLWTDSDGTVND